MPSVVLFLHLVSDATCLHVTAQTSRLRTVDALQARHPWHRDNLVTMHLDPDVAAAVLEVAVAAGRAAAGIVRAKLGADVIQTKVCTRTNRAHASTVELAQPRTIMHAGLPW